MCHPGGKLSRLICGQKVLEPAERTIVSRDFQFGGVRRGSVPSLGNSVGFSPVFQPSGRPTLQARTPETHETPPILQIFQKLKLCLA